MKTKATNLNVQGDTYLPLYHRNKKSIKFLVIFAILFILIGLWGIVSNIFFVTKIPFDLTLWMSIYLFSTGIINMFFLVRSLQELKYFIAWNEKAIIYFLPKQKELELVIKNEIKHITISDREIQMILNDNLHKIINLNFFFLPKRNLVKDYFETLRKEKCHGNSMNNDKSNK